VISRKTRKLQKAQALVEKFRNKAKTEEAKYRIDEIQLHTSGYAEPGYTDPKSGVIAQGNWNDISKWNEATHSFDKLDTTPGEVAAALEKIGVELEWCDEWVTCCSCQKIVRCEPNSYGWMRSYWETEDGEVECVECTQKDPTSYLEHLEGQNNSAMTIEIDLSEHGYKLVDSKFESGLYGGQAANPKLIAKALEEQNISRFIFVIDHVGQFDMDFSVWIHEEDWKKFDMSKFGQAKTDGPDPAVMMQKGFAALGAAKKPEGEGIVHSTISLDDGSVKVRVVTPEQFVKGISPNDP